MLNHFRTHLLNLGYVKDNEHIPEDYVPITLPRNLDVLYSALFPTNTTRYYKLFLAHNYLNVINAAGMTSQLTDYDPRISYDLHDLTYFKISRLSNPDVSNPDFPLFLLGKMESAKVNNYFYDSYLIRQVEATLNITIYSRINGVYIDEAGNTYSTPDDAEITVDFDGGSSPVSQEIFLGKTGISFQLGNGALFTGTSDKTWEFIAEAPYVFEFSSIFNKISALNPFASLKRFDVDISDLENIWNFHFNPVYKFAAFLLAYVRVINTL
jgi:hypothetical protein